MKPTSQQQAFLDTLCNTNSNILLQARAGCGKTSSILMAVDAYADKFPSDSIWVCAYNKSIADEVQTKLKQHGHTDWKKVSASTVHSAGYSLLRFTFGSKVEGNKINKLIYARIDSRDSKSELFRTYKTQISQLVTLAKQAGVGFFDDVQIGNPSTWYDLASHFGVNGFDDTSVMDSVIVCAQEIYRSSLDNTDEVDFDDMILFPLIKSITVKFTKDLIFVDEAQDLSRARQALIKKFLKPVVGRIVIVGDDKQAIYGFSGADSQALRNLASSVNAVTLPLSVTWRCPKKVVELAKTIVGDLEAAESAKDGSVEYLSSLDSLSTPLAPGKEQDAILCRNTAPLIEIAYELIRKGVPAKVEGRKIGEGLINLCQRWKVTTTAALIEKLEAYREREIQKAIAKGNDAKIEGIEDTVETVLEIIKAVNAKGQTSVSDVIRFIEDLFADGADHVVTLCTYHKSKGREWERVILWEHTSRCPSKYAKQDWQREQESNLAYVAITRSKDQLVFVN